MFGREWLTGLRLVVLIVAAITVAMAYVMMPWPFILKTAVIMGAAAAACDLAFEAWGVWWRKWCYTSTTSLRGIPLELPVLYFCGAFALTFLWGATWSEPYMMKPFIEGARGLSWVQVLLLVLAAAFFAMYLAGKHRCITFFMMPLGLLLYLDHGEPYMLVYALLPMYLDYLVEGSLVKRGEVRYSQVDAEEGAPEKEKQRQVTMASVSVTYFASTLVLFGLMEIVIRWFIDWKV